MTWSKILRFTGYTERKILLHLILSRHNYHICTCVMLTGNLAMNSSALRTARTKQPSFTSRT